MPSSGLEKGVMAAHVLPCSASLWQRHRVPLQWAILRWGEWKDPVSCAVLEAAGGKVAGCEAQP